jgi:phosphoribosylformylglycinamidine cyclo-ligase
MRQRLSYASTGVDIDQTDAAKRAMAKSMETSDPRVLNRIGAFATLLDASFPGYDHPVLVHKSEEPGSKQKLAFAHGRHRSVCYDMVNHLIDDIIVMGAAPVSIQDVIVCGTIDGNIVNDLVDAMAEACRLQDCTLTGGETSVQPGVVPDGLYVLTASVIGVVDKDKIIDGSTITAGDQVLVLASNGLHTNGYTLVRALIDQQPDLLARDVEGESLLDAVLKPHTCYFQPLRDLFATPTLHGMAHITGGGLQDNLNRVLPADLNARLDLAALEIPAVFRTLRSAGDLADEDMMRTFNMGAGMALVVAPEAVEETIAQLAAKNCRAYRLGEIVSGEQKVELQGALAW